MNAFYLLYEYGIADISLFDCDNEKEFLTIIDYLSVKRWLPPSETDGIQAKIQKSKPKTFDVQKDFDCYFGDFIRFYNINLKTDDIDYFTFTELLENLFFYDSAIAGRVKARSYEKEDNENPEYVKSMTNLKNTYSLE